MLMHDKPHDNLSPSARFVFDFCTGGASGAVAKTMVAPIDRVKLIMQTQDINADVLSGRVARYTGIGSTFRRILVEQGALSFYRGNLANVLRYFPTQAFNLSLKDRFKAMLPHYSPDAQMASFVLVQLASGSFAGASSLLLTYPLDVARTRLASDVNAGGQKRFSGIVDVVRQIYTSQGAAALYRGFLASLLGIVVYRGVQFGLNDSLSAFNPHEHRIDALGVASLYVVAQVSVTTAALCSYPWDTARRRVQMESEKPPRDRRYAGMRDCFAKTLRKDGVKGLYRGFLLNCFRTIGSSTVLVLYGEAHNIFGHHEDHH